MRNIRQTKDQSTPISETYRSDQTKIANTKSSCCASCIKWGIVKGVGGRRKVECGTEEKRKERTRRKERKERKERWGNRKGNKLRKLFRLGLFSFVSAECIMLRVPRFLARRGHYERTKQRKSISIMLAELPPRRRR